MSVDPEQDLSHFLLGERLDRIEKAVNGRTKSLAVVAEDLEDPHNISAVMRTCEGFGVQDLHVVTKRFAYRPNRKITQGCEKWMNIELHADTASCFSALKSRGFVVCVTDLAPGASSLLELPQDKPLALVFGNEREGISPEALALADVRFQIPMQGFSQSLNVSVAAAVCISHLTFERIRKTGSAGDLAEEEKAALRQRYCAFAIRQRGRVFSEKTLQNLRKLHPSKRFRRFP